MRLWIFATPSMAVLTFVVSAVLGICICILAKKTNNTLLWILFGIIDLMTAASILVIAEFILGEEALSHSGPNSSGIVGPGGTSSSYGTVVFFLGLFAYTLLANVIASKITGKPLFVDDKRRK